MGRYTHGDQARSSRHRGVRKPAGPAAGPRETGTGRSRTLGGGMSETTTFPRRDADGRVVRLAELLAWVAAGLVIGVVVLLLVDGVSALLGLGRFGRLSGWLAGILPVWLFTEEFRAWRGVPGRAAVAVISGLPALILGFAGAQTIGGVLPPLGAGAVGATIGALLYGALWYVGIRWLADRGVPR
jgi:hypothetical protein